MRDKADYILRVVVFQHDLLTRGAEELEAMPVRSNRALPETHLSQRGKSRLHDQGSEGLTSSPLWSSGAVWRKSG